MSFASSIRDLTTFNGRGCGAMSSFTSRENIAGDISVASLVLIPLFARQNKLSELDGEAKLSERGNFCRRGRITLAAACASNMAKTASLSGAPTCFNARQALATWLTKSSCSMPAVGRTQRLGSIAAPSAAVPFNVMFRQHGR
eukprot:scaffold161122_cov22-Prasinocladus_malaysianus.AAC.1